jgi:AcrR family transcriptional regulator
MSTRAVRQTRSAASPRRVRSTPDERRVDILDAARQVMVERGIVATRVTDVAVRAGVSHGLVHYYFPTKDDLVAATMHHVADVGVQRLRRMVAAEPTAQARLDRLLDLAVPGASRASDAWVLWVDAWSAGLRDATVRAVHDELDTAWSGALVEIIDEGVGTGEFSCDDPATTATVLTALVDGLSLRLVLRQRGVTRPGILRMLRAAAAQELATARP